MWKIDDSNLLVITSKVFKSPEKLFRIALRYILFGKVLEYSVWLSVAGELAMFMLRPKTEVLPSIYHNNFPSTKSNPFSSSISRSNRLARRQLHKSQVDS
jgi:hypothetical protein